MCIILMGKKEDLFSQNNACSRCNITIGEMEPRTFHLILLLECAPLVAVLG